MNLKIIAIIVILINVIACMAMMLDKSYAVKNKWRLSESFLLSFSFIGGGVGLMIGMIVFRQKLSKLKFRIIAPLGTCLYTAAFLYFMWIEKIAWL